MTPEQQERVANARLARKQEAIDAQWEEVERRRKRRDELLLDRGVACWRKQATEAVGPSSLAGSALPWWRSACCCCFC